MQAARGASLTPSDHVTSPDRRRRARQVFVILVVTGLLIDQGSKVWALAALADSDRALLGDWFTLHLVFNPGAAFSLGTEYTVVLTCLAIVAVGVILFLSRRLGSIFWAWGLGLLLAGVGGNLIDRVFRDPSPMRGHVVDFLRLPNWPVFNFADVFINVAAAIIIVQSFRGIALDGSRDTAAAKAEEQS
ncbi:signal peptidase II [Nocardioides campestrisoli]|uniref:signal peptidase II n=1 Tax=Nocardioides campestrisoli TaxID=2736757 RepID=UPI0015E6F604|nr:signal peptidase II [Nocardioides campestrisoli]